MSANWGNNIELSIFGESHGPAIGIVIGGLPAGMKLDMDEIRWFMKRRAPGQNQMSTPRKEKDEFQIVSGILDGVTTGAPLCAMIENTNTHSKDYSELKVNMRPGHSDYPAYIKYHGYNDVRGGGHFSGRLTAPIVLAGSIARQILLEKGIIPIVNENDAISIDEIQNILNFGDNDNLSAIVSTLVNADTLIILSDIDGFYDSDPRTNEDSKMLKEVYEITPEIEECAGGAGSNRGTGGMVTKLSAAKVATSNGIDMILANGENPEILIDILNGEDIGTMFVAKKGE